MQHLYTDFWELIAQHLDPDDIYNFSLTCKSANKASRKPTIQNKISYPLLYPWKLTYEQRSLIKKMELGFPKGINLIGTPRFKLLHGDVGSGKTITSISYAIRNYTDPDSKIVMCGPPSLVRMWWNTLRKFFGIEPAVFHGTNTKYKASTSFKVIPNERFIIFSYKVYWKHIEDCENWFHEDRDILIIDEAHHQTSIPITKFKEVIGLSATTTKKGKIKQGIRNILRTFGLEERECTYSLGKRVLGRKLPPIEYHSYNLKINDKVKQACIRLIEYTKAGNRDKTSVANICRMLSHPEILDLREYHTGGNVMVGRKYYKVPRGNEDQTIIALKKLREENPGGLDDRKFKLLQVKYATFDIVKLSLEYPKHIQALHIVINATKKGDKVLLFDMSTEYLPFLHQMFNHYGVTSYMFSSHYDVTGRQRQLTKFKEDPKPCVLLSSVSMLGEGQNVTQANHVIFFTQCLDHTRYYQAIGRCWRHPQRKVVHFHLLFASKFDQEVYVSACGGNIESHNWTDLLSQ